MQWDPTLAMGVPEIDEQHREIVRSLDGLIGAIRRGASREEVGRTLAFLRDHASRHFDAEEALMRDAGFRDLQRHRMEHETFVRHLSTLEGEHARDGGSPTLILRVSNHLASWLREHVFKSDRALADFLRVQR